MTSKIKSVGKHDQKPVLELSEEGFICLNSNKNVKGLYHML